MAAVQSYILRPPAVLSDRLTTDSPSPVTRHPPSFAVSQPTAPHTRPVLPHAVFPSPLLPSLPASRAPAVHCRPRPRCRRQLPASKQRSRHATSSRSTCSTSSRSTSSRSSSRSSSASSSRCSSSASSPRCCCPRANAAHGQVGHGDGAAHSGAAGLWQSSHHFGVGRGLERVHGSSSGHGGSTSARAARACGKEWVGFGGAGTRGMNARRRVSGEGWVIACLAEWARRGWVVSSGVFVKRALASGGMAKRRGWNGAGGCCGWMPRELSVPSAASLGSSVQFACLHERNCP